MGLNWKILGHLLNFMVRGYFTNFDHQKTLSWFLHLKPSLGINNFSKILEKGFNCWSPLKIVFWNEFNLQGTLWVILVKEREFISFLLNRISKMFFTFLLSYFSFLIKHEKEFEKVIPKKIERKLYFRCKIESARKILFTKWLYFFSFSYKKRVLISFFLKDKKKKILFSC